MSTSTDSIAPPTTTPQNGSSSQSITPTRAGTMGAALGLGVGLLFGELIVPGIVIAAAAGVGIAALRARSAKTEKVC
jgi:hypothetical protein